MLQYFTRIKDYFSRPAERPTFTANIDRLETLLRDAQKTAVTSGHYFQKQANTRLWEHVPDSEEGLGYRHRRWLKKTRKFLDQQDIGALPEACKLDRLQRKFNYTHNQGSKAISKSAWNERKSVDVSDVQKEARLREQYQGVWDELQTIYAKGKLTAADAKYVVEKRNWLKQQDRNLVPGEAAAQFLTEEWLANRDTLRKDFKGMKAAKPVKSKKKFFENEPQPEDVRYGKDNQKIPYKVAREGQRSLGDIAREKIYDERARPLTYEALTERRAEETSYAMWKAMRWSVENAERIDEITSRELPPRKETAEPRTISSGKRDEQPSAVMKRAVLWNEANKERVKQFGQHIEKKKEEYRKKREEQVGTPDKPLTYQHPLSDVQIIRSPLEKALDTFTNVTVPEPRRVQAKVDERDDSLDESLDKIEAHNQRIAARSGL